MGFKHRQLESFDKQSNCSLPQPCYCQGCGSEKPQPEKVKATAFLPLQKACFVIMPVAHARFWAVCGVGMGPL